MTRVKICCIKSAEDAQAVAAFGADELGFHVKLNGGRSPLEADVAKALVGALPKSSAGVVVTSLTDAKELIEIAQATGASTLQLYGDATPETIREFKKALPEVKIWKVLNVSDKNSIEKAKEYEDAADAIALDTLNKATGVRGGTGKTHDWSISKRIVESISIPVILAGGLNPDNIAEAIRTVRPYGVDVNSGVSNPDGSKDLEKVKLFIERARNL